MTNTTTKNTHDKFQRDVSLFQNSGAKNVVDVMVVRQIKGGRTNVNDLATAMKITKDQLLSSISHQLYRINGDTITEA